MIETDYLQTLHDLQAVVWPENLPRTPQYPKGERPLTEYLRAWAGEQPDKTAVHFYGHELSYARLDALSDRCANLLLELGVQPGDRVAVFMPNCPQLHIAFYGILKCGGVYAPVSPLSKAMELRYQLQDCGARVILCFDQLYPVLQAVRPETSLCHVITSSLSELRPEKPVIPLPDLFFAPKQDHDGTMDFYSTLDRSPESRPKYRSKLTDIAALNYTGGTTGLPKGCIHTHGDMLYTCASYTPTLQIQPDTVTLNFLPEFWIAGENNGLLFPVFTGATMVLFARWDALAFMAAVQHYRVTQCGLLVDSVAEVLDHPNVGDYDFTTLETTGCISFIKKLTREYRVEWRKLTGCTLFELGYGMTETHTCDTFTAGFQADDFDLTFGPIFVGLPVPGTEFKVCDFETGALLPLGSEGELCIRTPSLFKGYWGQKGVEEPDTQDSWFPTGDLGLISETGFIRYLGRRKEMLKEWYECFSNGT